MRITQGTFSFLADLSDEQIRAQIEYCLGRGWAVSIEYTDDPHPRNTYWEMYGNPMFDLHDAAGVMVELAYHASQPLKDGTFHKVVIRSKRPDLAVRAKSGYYAREASESGAPSEASSASASSNAPVTKGRRKR